MKDSLRAKMATIIFIFSLILFVYIQKINIRDVFPLVLYFIALVLNSYFSMKLFMPLSKGVKQILVDAILFSLFLMMAYSINNFTAFFVLNIFLFAVATLKYAFLLNAVSHPKLLKRKICIDIYGAILGLLVLCGSLMHYEKQSAWFLALVFLVANYYLFFIKPLYRLDN